MPPLGNLKTETKVGTETINGDTWSQEYYTRNNQTPEVKTGGIQPFTDKKPVVKTEPTYPATDDEGLKKALKKDQRKRNINN